MCDLESESALCKEAPRGVATHVLDGLLYHESDFRIEEHYTDTSGFTDHVFALCHFGGFCITPRKGSIQDYAARVESVSIWTSASSRTISSRSTGAGCW